MRNPEFKAARRRVAAICVRTTLIVGAAAGAGRVQHDGGARYHRQHPV